VVSQLATPLQARQQKIVNRARRTQQLHRVGRIGLVIAPAAGYFFLWAPIVLLVAFSFNASSSLATWSGFSFQWYQTIFDGAIGSGSPNSFSSRLMLNALGNSVFVALMATLISTVIGTLVALSLARGRYPGRRLVSGLLYAPIIIPDITQGLSLALFFKVVFDFIQTISGERPVTGFSTIIIGHVAFNISYVAIVVGARLADMNPRYEEAAADLGASPWQAFRRVTLPLLMPGIIAGGLLAFTMSLDDFVVAFFLSGVGTSTLPLYVYSLLKVSVTPEINAISTVMLIASTVLVGASLLFQWNATKAAA
jgi:spermidine/putrescine transport system permease protein